MESDLSSETTAQSESLQHQPTQTENNLEAMNNYNRDLTRTKSIAEEMSPTRELLFVGILCTAQFTCQMGLGSTLAILHVIGEGLEISNAGVLSWLIAGYSLTVGSFILISGRFGDVFGYKRMMAIGYAWFALWSLVAGCAVYSGEVLFIFARVLGGIGPAITLPNALGLLGATYAPGKKKNMIFSLFGATAPAGAVAGGAFAGLWSLVWWPWTFWTFAIACFALSVLAVFILPSVPIEPEYQGLSLRRKIVELDMLGATVGITAMILFNFAWNEAPGFGWQQAYIYVLLIIGLLMFIPFFYIELKIAHKPLIPFDALSTDVSFVLGCIACGWASFGIWVYYFFQFLQVLRHETPLLSVAHATPLVVSGFCAAVLTGKVIGRLGPGWVMLISMCAFLTGNILIATAPIHQTYWAQVFVCAVVIPWGMDMSFPAGTLILSNAVKKEHQGMGASLVNTVVNYSISIGVGIAGTVEVHVGGGQGTVEEILKGYRGAQYLAVGISGLGVFIAFMFLAKMTFTGKMKTREEMEVVEKNEA